MKKIITFALVTLVTSPIVLLADMDRCVSCHGVDFEKRALGVSRVVQDMNESAIKEALDGYKAGKGGAMKELMMAEVNLGVDTDAMAGDIYHESRTKGFDEPNDEFIFQKRLNVRSLHKLKGNIKMAEKKDMKKVSSQIKATAFNMYAYDKALQSKVSFNDFKPKKLTKKEILETVTHVKKCVDHSFSVDEMVVCEVEFFNLAGNLVKNEEKKMKAKSLKHKAPLFTGEGAVDISKYLEKK
jgi:cytochrome c553